MHEDRLAPADGCPGPDVRGDNVVTLPNLTTGRLADLLAAAGGPAQAHELRGEPDVLAAFRVEAAAWPTTRRRFRRTPAVLAVTTVATIMVATTGLAAASELPGPAGRTVQGILGSVGVTVAPPAATDPAGSHVSAGGSDGAGSPVAAGASAGAAPRTGAASGRFGCAPGTSGSRAVTGVRAASCTIAVAQGGAPGVRSTTPTTAPRAPVHTPAPPVVHGPTGTTHQGGTSGGGSGSVPVTTTPGGGSSRGGNLGAGGTCTTGTGSTTTTSPPTTTTTTSTTTTTAPAGVPGTVASPGTTGATGTGSGCGGHGHHRGSGAGRSPGRGGGGTTAGTGRVATTTTTTTTTAP